jgi:hypothetical protein
MIIDSPIVSGSQFISGSSTQVGDAVISGSLTVTGAINATITGSITSASYANFAETSVSSSFALTASYAANVPLTASNANTASYAFFAVTASYTSNAELLDGLDSTSFATTTSFNSLSSSFATTSGSVSTRLNVIETTGYATTGSNIFTGPQYVNQASNAISFTSTASLYTDGGLRVAKDSFVSGTAYFNNITVYGTSSIQYITSSQVNIGANIITVNTDTPSIRFGGLSVFDSGSTQLTGSMLWDSEKNHWIYSNPSGSTYNSGMIMSGPRNSGSLGDEQGTTFNALMKGQGGDHITSSQIFDDGTTVTIPGNLQVTGSIIGTATNATSASYSVSSSFAQTSVLAQTASYFITSSVTNATSASYALTASYAANVPLTASNANTASFAFTASYVETAQTASFVTTAQTASYVLNAISSSFALTASYISGSGGGVGFPFSGSAVITGSLLITDLSGSGVRYVTTNADGLLVAQTASAAIISTQLTYATAGQTIYPISGGYTTGLVDVFVNGTKLNSTEYVDTSGVNIVLTTGSFVNDVVEFQKYFPASGVTNNALRQVNYFTATEGQTVFSASYTPGLLDVFYNGSKLDNTEYTANSGNAITLATASAAGDKIEIDVYSYQVGSFSGIGGTASGSQIAYFNTSNSITGSPNFTVSGSSIVVTGSLVVSGSGTFVNIGPAVFSGSLTSTQGFTGSFSGVATTASFAQTASSIANLNQNVQVTGSMTVSSTITAQTLNVQQVTSSIVYSSGSNIFGNSLGNTQQLTGSVTVTGSFAVTTTGTELQVGATGVTLGNVLTDNHNVTGSLRVSGSLTGVGATFSGQVEGTIINSTSNAFRLNGNNALSLVTLGGQSVVKINAAGFWGVQLVGANDQGIVINNTGNVGIGTSTPASLLDLYLSSVGTYFRGGSDNVARQLKISSSTTTNAGDTHTFDAQSGTGVLVFATTSTERMRLNSSQGLVMADGMQVLTTGGYYRLRTSAGATTGLFIQKNTWAGFGDASPTIAAETGYSISFFTNGNNTERLRIQTDGIIYALNNGVDGTYQPMIGGMYSSNNNETNLISTAVSSAANQSGFRFDVSNGAGSTGRTTSMTINRSSVTIVGSLSKGSGSFKIKHPLTSKKNTHYLVHSFIEGPQADLIYRGKVRLVAGRAVVNIDEAATMTEGTFEALCREVQCFTSNETSWDAVRGKVEGNILTIECQNTESTDEISWLVIGERQDEHMMDTEWTDENGRVIVEPLIPEENK